MSSPPARGSSPPPWRHLAEMRVVPARAGIFRRRHLRHLREPGRPRPRGDLPPRLVAALVAGLSSPPARGSSAAGVLVTLDDEVVPARAGIFPRAAPRCSSCGCRPRPRGDLPSSSGRGWRRRTSSPPARGSSAHHRAAPDPRGVVPARAGIFRARGRRARRPPRRPRPRGDLPPGDLRADVVRRVVPARAGIFRSPPTARPGRHGRPRPRGDLPASTSGRSHSLMSSPPARGSSRERRRRGDEGRVVPARAGIFRPRTLGPWVVVCRPRPRGDLPT